MFDSDKYFKYLANHISGVKTAFKILVDNGIVEWTNSLQERINNHDKSKYLDKEFFPYGEKFYGDKQNSDETRRNFDYAWNCHLHHQDNSHHWQWWCLKEDDTKDLKALDMDDESIVEMICDWWSFGINKKELSEIFKWYESHVENMILSKNTQNKVEFILKQMKKIV